MLNDPRSLNQAGARAIMAATELKISSMAAKKERKQQGKIKNRKNETPSKSLHLEDYQAFFHNPHPPHFTVPLLNQILHINGFHMFRRKDELQVAMEGLTNLLEPHRSTLNDTVRPYNHSNITIHQINADLDALEWQEFTPVQSLQFELPTFENDNGLCEMGDNGGDTMKRVIKKKKKMKERKVFDAVHRTKPRSRRQMQKRKYLHDIVSDS